MSQKEVEHQKQIALKREETAQINAPNELRINKSVKSSPFRMHH